MPRTEGISWVLTAATLLILSACIPLGHSPTTTPLPPSASPSTRPPQTDPAIGAHFCSSPGPFLLTQTGLQEYHLIDIHTLTAHPVVPPVQGGFEDLSRRVSPSGSELLVQSSLNEISIVGLETGRIKSTYFLLRDSPQFQIDGTVLTVQEGYPNLGWTQEFLRAAVQEAYTASLQNFSWYGEDRYWLSVLACSETATCLHLHDRQAGTVQQLENQPGFVHTYWMSPEGKEILLQKEYIFDPLIWQDAAFYLMSPTQQEALPIPLPEEVSNPSVFWAGSGLIGIIHQPGIGHHRGFSLYDPHTRSLTEIIPGDFTGVTLVEDRILALTSSEADGSTITAIGLDGETLDSARITARCIPFSHLTSRPQYWILNCDSGSYAVDPALTILRLSESLFLLSPAPDGEKSLLVDSGQDSAHLVNATLTEKQPIRLEGSPLEILWNSDSSGFVYRTLTGLHYVDLLSGQVNWLVGVQEIGDYANLNAAWIRPPQ